MPDCGHARAPEVAHDGIQAARERLLYGGIAGMRNRASVPLDGTKP